jgi:hypothetical protein
MDPEIKTNGRSDHDILIELSTKLERVISDIKDLGKGITESTAQLRESKLEKDVFNRWEIDFRREFEKELNLIKDNLIKDIMKIGDEMKKAFGEQEKRIDDHERRIRRLERWVFMGIGGLALLQIIVAAAK